MQPTNQPAKERVGGLPKEERAAHSGWFPNKQNTKRVKRPATCELASCATTLGERGIGELIRVLRMCTVSVVETGVISHAECNCRATTAGNHLKMQGHDQPHAFLKIRVSKFNKVPARLVLVLSLCTSSASEGCFTYLEGQTRGWARCPRSLTAPPWVVATPATVSPSFENHKVLLCQIEIRKLTT
jgi:hypothetical protein